MNKLVETINWIKEERQNHDSFIAWLILRSLTHAQENAKANGESHENATKKYFTDLGLETKHWTECKITMQINGIEVPVQKTLDDIEQQIDKLVAKKAMEIITEKTSLSGLIQVLNDSKQQIIQQLRDAGITVSDEED